MQSIETLAAARLATTQANFPFLKHAFLPSGISGLTNTDVIGNVKVTDAAGWTLVSAEKFRAKTATQSVTGGTFVAPGLSDFMMISIGNASGGSVKTVLGETDVDGPGIDLRAGVAAALVLGEFDYHDVGVLSTLTDLTAMAITRSSDTVKKYGCKDSAAPYAVVAGASAGAGVDGAWGALDSQANFTANASSWYTGVYFCVFEGGLPGEADIKRALAWMSKNPGLLPPWWAGRQ